MTPTDRTLTHVEPSYLDRVVDVDTHEMIPFHMWGEHFGDQVARTLAACELNPFFADNGVNTAVRPDIVADDVDITPETVWHTRGSSAPGAIDMGRRADVMDMMGVQKSLMFPSFGLMGILMASSPEFVAYVMGLGLSVAETKQAGLETVAAYNDWVVRSMRDIDSARMRPVAIVGTESLDGMMAELERLVAAGVKAIWLPSGTPPANTSPADAALDPFWRTAADHDVSVLLHIGTDLNYVSSLMWTANVPSFAPPRASPEFAMSAIAGTTAHIAAEQFIATMVLGGVFERVPHLRFGALELGAQWLGPLAERMDMWAALFPHALADVISMKPSEYLARNVRVTPFHFEPVDEYFDRYEALASCYCYSSDYPHVEGGYDSKAGFAQRVERLDPRFAEMFFVSNGEWIVP